MANAKRFKKGSRTRDKGWTHCSVSASNIEVTAKVVGSNSEGSTIMLSAVAAGLIVGTTTKADADTVREATRSKIRVIIMANKGEQRRTKAKSSRVIVGLKVWETTTGDRKMGLALLLVGVWVWSQSINFLTSVSRFSRAWTSTGARDVLVSFC